MADTFTLLDTPERAVAETLSRAQRHQSEGARQAQRNDFNRGHVVRGFKLTSGTNEIPHKLGRVPTGWVLERVRDAAPNFFETALDAARLTVSSTTVAKVDIRFY